MLWGTTYFGGLYGQGTVFKCSTSGDYQVVAHLGGVVAYEGYEYDAAGNCILMRTPWGRFSYTWDARNQMTGLVDPGYALYGAAGGLSTWIYDARGLITREDWPNGTHTTVTYDPNGRALQVRHATSANAEVERALYSYDSLGNPLFKDTATGRYTYTYDAANQLTSEWNQAGRTTWTYDAAYRRATQRTLGSLANTTYTYDAADELLYYVTGNSRTSFSYDANGQTTKVQPPTGNPTSYSWDGAHRLLSATTPTNQRFTFVYDQDGLRIQKVGPNGTDSYLWDGQDPLVWMGPNGVAELTARGATLARVVGHRSGSVNLNRQYHTDALANVEAITDASQTAEVKPATDAWGNLLSGSATDQPYDFTGGLGYWHDPDLNLQYVRARWLNPSTGQWMSPDPVESEPRYSYAHQMPTTQVDPSGTQSRQASAAEAVVGIGIEAGQVANALWKLLHGDASGITLPIFDPPVQRGRPAPSIPSGNDPTKVLQDLGKAVFQQLYLSVTDPERAVESMSNWAESYWKRAVVALAGAERTAVNELRLQSFMDELPVPTPFGFVTAKDWNSARAYVRHDLQPYFPPAPTSPDGLEWMGGFLWGLVVGVKDIVKSVAPILIQGPMGTAEKQVMSVIAYLLKRPNILQDIFDYFHTVRNSFFNWFEDSYKKDRYEAGKTIGILFFNLVSTLTLVGGAVKGAAALIKWLREGGKIAELLAKAEELLTPKAKGKGTGAKATSRPTPVGEGLGEPPAGAAEAKRNLDAKTKSALARPKVPDPRKLITKKGTAFFWSGKTDKIGGQLRAAEIAAGRNGTTLEMLIEERGIDVPEWDPSNPDVVQFWKDLSEAYASGASGEVRAIIGQNLRPGNVWETIELPALENNPNVTKITIIDPATGHERVIFKR